MGIKREMTGVNLAAASQPSLRSSTHWADFHRRTHKEGLVLRPMCRSVSAGRSEMIGLPRGATQRAHCFPTAKTSTGMQYGAASNFQFATYLYRKSWSPSMACRLTLRCGFGNRDRYWAWLDKHQRKMGISFICTETLRCSTYIEFGLLEKTLRSCINKPLLDRCCTRVSHKLWSGLYVVWTWT